MASRLTVDAHCGPSLLLEEGARIRLTVSILSLNCNQVVRGAVLESADSSGVVEGPGQMVLRERALLSVTSRSSVYGLNGATWLELEEASSLSLEESSRLELSGGATLSLADFSSFKAGAESTVRVTEAAKVKLTGHWTLRRAELLVSSGFFLSARSQMPEGEEEGEKRKTSSELG